MRVAVLNRKKCKSKKCGLVCIKFCPGVRMGEETIVEDGKFPFISEDLCTGCGICINKCPFGAITIVNLPEETGKIIHQFGPNSFRLFNLPLPKKGSVLGLIGANGIGKTTAMRILAGDLVPNMGDYESEKTIDDVIESFRGSEFQGYFEKLRDKKIIVSFKPQNVELIPKFFEGTARELLEKIDGKAVESEVAREFEITDVLEKKLSNLSGGELQRVAIVAAALKEADIYFFDEPTSYLDVSQRLKIAKILRMLTEKGKSVVLIEHDLAILDYLSDSVRVLFGKEGAFGIVSAEKSVRLGINEYLLGFLKDENTRVRERAVKFEIRAPPSEWAGVNFFDYPDLEKKLGNFSLKVKGGSVRRGEVVGILGPNATGKSTFVKMLAGEISPDNIEFKTDYKISYKPQYLKSDFDGTVRDFIACEEDIEQDVFESEIKNQMNLGVLMDLKMSDLSGGQLQRVAVSVAMGKKADIYLLDEPSAFFDIDQRLEVAGIIRRVTEKRGSTTLVVDHDILVIDFISDRLLNFSGESSK
ncbi:MAG: ribosome biogenesis/translation initiation ATPase RLI, partial [Candidatus Diapherotrites archaeon]|nr:ribosome biogenesis/translation initiation ATPase RLI [Candidatus Diapherotrites archaeon]